MKATYPYLSFAGRCEEALQFYADVFGGRITTLMRWDQMLKDASEADRQRIMHAHFEAPGLTFMANDGPPGTLPAPGGPVSLSLDCDDKVEQERIWARLADGGEPSFPLHDTFYGGRLGALTDRFGIQWMLSWQPDQP